MAAPRASARPRLARLGTSVRHLLTGSNTPIPHLGETIVRAVTVGSSDTVAAARMHADTVITPAVEGTGLVDWKSFPRMVEIGREAARQALASGTLREWVES
jgi:predicted acylesterase/phospholipase RssA